jgi:hypothetical protein
MDLLREGDPYYNPNLGRLQPWCPLRPPEEDEEWLSLVTGLIEAITTDDQEPDADDRSGSAAEHRNAVEATA